MATRKKTGVIPQAGTLTGDEILAIVQNGNSRRTTLAEVAALAGGGGGGGGGTVRQITDADGVDEEGTLTFAVLPEDINGTIQLTSSDVLDPARALVIPEGAVGDRLTVQFVADLLAPIAAAELLVLASNVAYVIVLDGAVPYAGIPQGSTVEILKVGTLAVGPDTYHLWYVVNGRGDTAPLPPYTPTFTRSSMRSGGTTFFETDTLGNFAGGGTFAATVAVYLTDMPAALEVIAGLWMPGVADPGWFVGVDANRWRAGHQDALGTLRTNTDGATLVPAMLGRLNVVTFLRYGTSGYLIVNGIASDPFTVETDAGNASNPTRLLRANSVGTPYWFVSGGFVGFHFMENLSLGGSADTIAAMQHAQLMAITEADLEAFNTYFGAGSYYTVVDADSPQIIDQSSIRSAFSADPAWPVTYGTPNLWAADGGDGPAADQWAHPPIVATIDDTDSPFTVLPEHGGGIIRVDTSNDFVEMNMPPALAATKPFRVGFELIDGSHGAEVTSDGVLTFYPLGQTSVGVDSEGITWVTLTDTTRGSVVADLLALEVATTADFVATTALSRANNAQDVADDALSPTVRSTHTTVTRTIMADDAGDILPFSGASNAVAIAVPHSLFGTAEAGRAFAFRGVITDVTNPITIAGTGGLVLYYYGPKSLLDAVGDTFIVKVVSATEAWVYIFPRGVPGIDYVEGFVADAGTAANRRGYTRGSDPLSATPSFTAVVVGRITNTTFVSGGSRQLFGTRSAAAAAGGGWCIYNEGDVIGVRFTDNGGTQRSSALAQSTTAWRVLHMTVSASGADLTIRLFADGAQILEVYDGAAGGQYTAGAEMCVGVLDEGAILPAALNNRIHGAGYATAAMTPTEVGAHADAIIAANKLVQTSSGTALADGWRADVALGTPAAATWASFLGGTALTTLNTTALTLAAQTAPVRWW